MNRDDWDPWRDLVIPLVIIALVVAAALLVGGPAIFNP